MRKHAMYRMPIQGGILHPLRRREKAARRFSCFGVFPASSLFEAFFGMFPASLQSVLGMLRHDRVTRPSFSTRIGGSRSVRGEVCAVYLPHPKYTWRSGHRCLACLLSSPRLYLNGYPQVTGYRTHLFTYHARDWAGVSGTQEALGWLRVATTREVSRVQFTARN